ncbi:MAG: hypoxanthine-guanine phosphoribosyltransferase [Methylococcales bacterium]|nr:hypoxanthine-guanine phosphoribosyltransferase [Methylococcales bacterium]
MTLLDEIEQVRVTADCLYAQHQVEAALDTLAAAINQQLTDLNPLVLSVLNGGIITTGHLLTRLTMPLTLDSVMVSRYHNQTTGQDNLTWKVEPGTPLAGRTVLVVDDILDHGITLHAVVDYCRQHGAQAVFSAVLVEKQLAQSKPIQADFVGLATDDRYLFGYGLDYKGYLRNMPGIYACVNL